MPELLRVVKAAMFTFTTSSTTPEARVRCHLCGWEATGDNPRRVFPQADRHRCRRKRR